MKNNLYTVFVPPLLLLCTILFVIPVDIAVNNVDNTKTAVYTIFIEGSVFVLLFTICVFAIYALLSIRAVFLVLLFAVAISAWFNAVFLFGVYGEIDGRGLGFIAMTLMAE